jgi:hypothetical protein
MKHPDEKCQRNQEEFLVRCPEEQRAFHARLFRIGNATMHYHNIVLSVKNEIPEVYYTEWLEGLPANIRAAMKKKGFEACKTMLSFTQYVNERQDIGMDEWMKEHLSPKDYEYYKRQG